jgi:predicted permease
VNERASPRGWVRRLLEWTLPYEDRSALSAEMRELYDRRAARHGRAAADRWYLRQASWFVLRLGAERVRDLIGTADSWRSEIRQGARTFVRQPGYSAAFVVVLALGTGGVTALYSAAERLLLRPVAGVTASDELVTIRLTSFEAPPHVFYRVSHPDLELLREMLTTTRGLAGASSLDVHMRTDAAGAQRLGAEIVTTDYFDVLGMRLHAGRGFGTGAAGDGTRVILSHRLARTLAGEVGAVIGRSVRVNGREFEVIGVAPQGFSGADLAGRAEMWFTLSSLPLLDASVAEDIITSRYGAVWSMLYGRMSHGASPEAVLANVEAALHRIRRENAGGWHPFMVTHLRFEVTPGVGLNPGIRPTVQRTLALLSCAAALLLLLSVANLANLALTRATSRRSATGVRLALGSSRARVARELWIETLLLGSAAGVATYALSVIWLRVFSATQLTAYGGTLGGLHASPRLIVLAFAGAIAAAGVAGMQPALSAGRNALAHALRGAHSGDSHSPRVRAVLVGTQVAISMVLVLGAGLLGRTVVNLRSIDLGFEPDNIVTFAMDPALDGIEFSRVEALARQLESDFAQTPGVHAAGWVSPPPLRTSYITASLRNPADAEPVIGAGYFVTPGFMRALGVRVLAGDAAWNTEPGTVVISRNVAAALFPGQPPARAIGKPVDARGTTLRIAAVIEDVQLSDITREPPPVFLRPLAERYEGLQLNAFVNGSSGLRGVRRMLDARGGAQPYFDLRTARAAIDEQFAERNLMARVATVLSVLGLLIAAVGLYAMLAYTVVLRRHEIGIRIALGATAADVRLQFMQRALVLSLAGAIVGAIGGLAVSRVLRAQLFGVEALDTATYVGAMLVVIVVASLAALLPSIQAARVPPGEALRSD